MNDGIIILGMHRSGTSLAAELVHRWGAFGQVEECLPSDKWNARGYFEFAPLVDFNTRLLREVGASWTFPPSPKDDIDLAELARRADYKAEAMALLASMKPAQDNNWFWKDPRLSLLLPFWQEIWGSPRYVICVRDPIEICRSLGQRDDLSFAVSIMLWQRYILSILEWTRNQRVIVLSYSRVLQTPTPECERLARFLNDDDAGRQATQVVSEMKKAVDRELRHAKPDSQALPGILTASQTKLFETMEKLAECEETSHMNWERFSLPRGWRSFLRSNLFLLRCQRRWNRMFPELPTATEPFSALDNVAASYARGLDILEVNTPFGGHSGFLSNALAQSAKQLSSPNTANATSSECRRS